MSSHLVSLVSFYNKFKYGIFHRNIKAEMCEILIIILIFEEKMPGQDFEKDVIYMC